MSLDSSDDVRDSLRLLKEALVKGIKRAGSPLRKEIEPSNKLSVLKKSNNIEGNNHLVDEEDKENAPFNR